MQHCNCGVSYKTIKGWVCKKCYNASYCSPKCRKLNKECHKLNCTSFLINKDLDLLVQCLKSSKPFIKMIHSMLTRSKYSISLSRTELRMIRESPVKNFHLIRERMSIIDTNDDTELEYITLICESSSKSFNILSDTA